MFNKYYEDELTYLRQLGAEFSRANPTAAPYLAEMGADPDVERLLEGFAFLTGRLRQKLDDELPELTQSLMQMLWPHYLRPIPSMSILQFEPLPQVVREPMAIPRGTEVDSVPADGTACRFRTCYDVQLVPIELADVQLERPPGKTGHLRMAFRINPGVKGEDLRLDRLRLFLHGEPSARFGLYLHLTRGLKRVLVRPTGGGADREIRLGQEAVRPVGFADDEALLPYPPHAFPGYRLIQEFFALPQKFLFLDVAGLSPLAGPDIEDGFEIVFEFARPPDDALRVGLENVRLNCTPVVNLFSAQSDPLRIDHEKVEYLIRPGGANPNHAEVFSVDRMKGWLRGTTEQKDYPSFFSFRHGLSGEHGKGIVYWISRLREAVVGRGVDTYVSFVAADEGQAIPPTETVVAELTCTNRALPAKLRIGDLKRSTGSSPEFATFKNITAITPSVAPPLGGELHWRLISNLSLNYLSLASVEALRGILGVYNFLALYDRQAARENELRLNGIVEVRATPEERLHQGAPVRGTRVEIDMKEENYAGEGEMVLFASVLNEFLALSCTLNAFCHLVVRGVDHSEVYEWMPRIGQQVLL